MKSADNLITIQEAMRVAFPETEACVARFYAMLEYQLGWRDEQLRPARYNPGKLARPHLSLLACRAVGGEWRLAVPLAAGIQLLHNFSLIHDDIEDQSTTRRGRPTVWKLWGIAQGINVGDGMCFLAHLALYQLVEAGVSATVALEIMQCLDRTVLAMCEGQFLDLTYEGDLSITEVEYLEMIRRKTAALIAAATGLGAIVGGADSTTAEALYDFGLNLGLAFQLQDDLLGIWGDTRVTGKPTAADLYRRKLSLPVIYAFHNSGQHETLTRLYAQKHIEDHDVRDILNILEHVSTQSYIQNLIASYYQKACDRLDCIYTGDAIALAELRSIAEQLSKRQS